MKWEYIGKRATTPGGLRENDLKRKGDRDAAKSPVGCERER